MSRALVMSPGRYTFLIDLGGEVRTVSWTGENADDARQVALSTLTDADKARVRSITPIARPVDPDPDFPTPTP